MSTADVAYVGACVLALVFAWAAVAKSIRHDETVVAFDALGLRAAPFMAWAVPAIELVTAALLVAVPSVGGLVALFLLVAFTAMLSNVIRHGAHVTCACFGGASSHPVSGIDLIRNAGLMLLAVAAIAATPPW